MKSSTRGRRIVKPRIPTPQPLEYNRTELIRLVVAHLKESPYSAIADEIEQQSGVSAISEPFANIMSSVNTRNWSLAFDQLLKLEFQGPEARSDAIKLIAEQWVIDLVLNGEYKPAIEVIRNNIYPWIPETASKLTWMIFESPKPRNCSEILALLTGLCSPEMFVEPSRLELLFSFAKIADRWNQVSPVFTGPNATMEYLVLHCLNVLGFEDLAERYRVEANISLENEALELREALGDQSWDLALSLMHNSLFDSPQHQQAAQKLVLKYASTKMSTMEAVKLARKYAPNDHQFVGSLLVETSPLDKYTFELSLGKHLNCSAIASETVVKSLCTNAIRYQALVDPYWCAPDISDVSLITNLKSQDSMLPTTRTQELCHDGEVWDIAFSPNGQYLATATRSGTIYVWRTLESGLVQHSRYPDASNPIQSICWSPDSVHVLAGCGAGYARLINTVTQSEHPKILCSTSDFGDISAVCWSPDGQYFFAGSYEGRLLRWSFHEETGANNMMVVTRGLRALSMSLASSVNGTVLIVLSVQVRVEDRSYHVLNIFDIESNELLKEYVLNASLSSLVVSGQMYAANRIPEGIYLWSWDPLDDYLDSLDQSVPYKDPLQDSALIGGPEQEEFRVSSSFGGPFDKYLVTGGEDCGVRIYNCVTKELVQLLTGHTDVVNTVKWSPTESLIASASDDRYVCIWRVSC